MNEKFQAISDKMNRITKELTKNIDLSEDMLCTTEDIQEVFNVAPVSVDTSETSEVQALASQIANSQAMIDDFNHMRSLLKQTTENSKRVLESVTEELMFSEGESRASLITAYSELNKAQTESIKLFILSYKEVSNILVNLNKLQQQKIQPQHTTNVLNVEASAVSVADMIERLRQDS